MWNVPASHATDGTRTAKNIGYFSVVENRRLGSGQVAQRTVLYLGEINDSQQASWRKTLEAFDEKEQHSPGTSLASERVAAWAYNQAADAEALAWVKADLLVPVRTSWLEVLQAAGSPLP